MSLSRLQDYVCATSNGFGSAKGCGHRWTTKATPRMPRCPKCKGKPGPSGSVFFDNRRFMDRIWAKLSSGADMDEVISDVEVHAGFKDADEE